MNAQQAKEVFNQVIAASTDADKIAKLELAREYFTNPKFRFALEQMIWEQNK